MAHIGSSRRFIFLIPVVALTCALSAQPVYAGSSEDDLSTSLRDFTSLYSTVQQNFADPLNPDQAIYDGAIPGMLLTLDPHSHFFDPRALKAMREDQSGHYYGVGMEVVGRNNQTIVVHPFVGSPAYKAGLLPNDVIANVSGHSAAGLSSTEVADLLRGARGTEVQIKVQRGEAGKELTFDVVRDAIPRSSVPSAFMIKPGIGYIKLEEFIETTGGDFDAALQKLGEENLKGLVLDLRANPGGLLTEAVSVAGHMLPKGAEVVSQHGRASQEVSYKATEGNHGYKYPIVVIVNSRSASASEIVSGALQDHDRAWILGDNTFGKGLVQTVFPLVESTGLALTTAKYYTPSGRLIQRDYSSVSFFDYYYRKNTEARNLADVKTTDTGRTVYGGGGISPDEKFEVPASPCVGQDGRLPACWGALETDLYLSYTFADYTKHFFSVNTEKLPVGWDVDAAQMEKFRSWLHDRKIEFTDAEFTKEYDMLRRRLQGEIYKTAFNLDESRNYALGTDPEVEAAIAALPKSQALLNRASGVKERAQK